MARTTKKDGLVVSLPVQSSVTPIDEKRLKCPHCAFVTTKHGPLKVHITTHHPKIEKLVPITAMLRQKDEGKNLVQQDGDMEVETEMEIEVVEGTESLKSKSFF